jgi:alkanesulfonate monooxygenase SsuD/methylene tetrahydromethanopterin reductase-like flavin-dependent oxidoreductase (luciferase family)
VCVSAICADSDEEAQREASSARPPAPGRGRVAPVAGSPERVRAGLEARARRLGADEILVVTVTRSHRSRMRSYALIAEAFRP